MRSPTPARAASGADPVSPRAPRRLGPRPSVGRQRPDAREHHRHHEEVGQERPPPVEGGQRPAEQHDHDPARRHGRALEPEVALPRLALPQVGRPGGGQDHGPGHAHAQHHPPGEHGRDPVHPQPRGASQGASFTRPSLECDHSTVSPYRKSMTGFATRRSATTVV